MTSLTMFLLQAPMDRLRELAQFWGLTDLAGSQEALVGSLMQELATPWSAADLLDRLAADERRVLYKLLDQPKGYMPLEALAHSLEMPMAALEGVLASLSRGAVVLVEEVQAPKIPAWDTFQRQARLAIAQERVAHVPVETLGLLRLARQAQQAGDVADLGLTRLLERLDAPALQRLAKRWHVLASHEYFRKDLIALLECRLRDRAALEGMLSRVETEVRLVYDAIKQQSGKMTVAALRERFPDGVLRRAFADLSDLYLIHQTYLDGERALFIPAEVLTASLAPAATTAAPQALQVVPAPESPRDAGFALAWDLLALASFLERQPVDLTVADHRLPKRTLARINALLQVKESAPAEGHRLSYLLHLASKLNLVEEVGNRLRGTAAVGRWAQTEFPAQIREIYDLWLDDRSWYEPAGFEALYWGSDRSAVRQRLIDYLRDWCQPGTWYCLPSFLRRLKATDPYFLRSPSDVLRLRGYRAVGEAARNWDQVEGRLVAALFEGPLYWLGMVSLGQDGQGNLSCFCLTPLGAWLIGSPGAAEPAPPMERPLVVQPNFEVVVLYPQSEVLYQLMRFARLLQADRASVYGLSKESVLAGLDTGLTVQEMLGFLAAHSQKPVPQNVEYSIADWARHFKPISLARVTLLETDDPAVLDQLAQSQAFPDLLVRRLSERAALVREDADLGRLIQELRKEGYAPRLAGRETGAASGKPPESGTARGA